MIFIFLENENENDEIGQKRITKIKWITKWITRILIKLSVKLDKIRELVILLVIGYPFLSKKYLFQKKNKIIFFDGRKFSKHVKKDNQIKNDNQLITSNFKHFIGILTK